MRRALLGLAVGAGLLLSAAPAAAENPVLDPEDDAEVAESLAEATQVQDVCYGYLLQVRDGDTGQFSGSFAASNGGPGVLAPAASGCPAGYVELQAQITYTSDFSEAEDAADWTVVSDVDGAPGIADVEALGLSSGDLLDDASAPLTLRNAVLALPALTAEGAGLPLVQAESNEQPLPEGAMPTGSPGSDLLRTSTAPLVLGGLAVLGGIALFASSFSRPSPDQ